MLYWRISSQTSNEQKYCKMMCLRKWVSCFDMKTVTVTSCLYTRFHLFYLCHLAIRLTQLRCLTIYSLSLFPLRVVCLHQYIYFSTSFENAHENRGGGAFVALNLKTFSLSQSSTCVSTSGIPPRGLSGAPLWRVRGPVGLPLSSNRPFFPGGGRPLRSGLPPLRSGLSWVMGLSPPRSILLHTPRGAPARENESENIQRKTVVTGLQVGTTYGRLIFLWGRREVRKHWVE